MVYSTVFVELCLKRLLPVIILILTCQACAQRMVVGILGSQSTSTADSTAPDSVTTLAIDSVKSTALYLSWTATGDNGSIGTATTYDLRYSTRAIALGNLVSNGTFHTSTQGWQLVN